MGTNFYINFTKKDLALKVNSDRMHPYVHIGKRSAAGLYCWDCNVTLNQGGISSIHSADSDWYEVCPICGQAPLTESLENSSAGLELGFNRKPYIKKGGVKSCSSFSWAMDKGSFGSTIKQLSKYRRAVIDEYGDSYTLKQFLKLVAACPLQFYGAIGHWFG